MPDATSDYAAGILDRRLVIAGGDYWEGSEGHWLRKVFSSQAQAFDPLRQKWERLPDLPEPISGAGSVVVKNRLLVLGGYTGAEMSRKIFALERKESGYAWSIFGALPVDRMFPIAVNVGTKIYLLGGSTRFEPLDSTGTCCTSTTATDSFMVLDLQHPESGWKQLPSMPGPRRSDFSAVATEAAVWVFGGRAQLKTQGPMENFSDLVFRYDIAKGQWNPAKPLPQKSPTSDGPSPVLVKGKILLITNVRTVWQLDPLTEQYDISTPLPEAALVDRFAWLDDRIVGAGGENHLDFPRRRSDWTFVARCGPE